MYKKWIALLLVLTFCFCLTVKLSVSATTDYDSRIKSVQERQEQLEQKKKDLNHEIKELEKNKEDVEKYISGLDQKMDKVTKSLNLIKGSISKKRKELKVTKAKFLEAEQNAKSQYDTMKKRIKYMYENGNAQYLELIFGAKDIGELLNRSEYVEKISEYDKNMLKRYQDTCEEIKQKKEDIEKRLGELDGLKEEADSERKALDRLTSSKQAELDKYNSGIEKSSKEKAAYEAQVAKAETEVENLLLAKQRQIEAQERARKKAAEEAARKNSGDGSDSNAAAGDSYQDSSGLRWPLKVGGRISSYFGNRTSPTAGASSYHKGIDIAVAAGTPIVASGSGSVVTAAYSSSAGNYVMIYHGKSTYTVYMHCSSLAVSEGSSVNKGQVIAYVGSTGISTGNHLHFGVMVNGGYVNPLSYVSQ